MQDNVGITSGLDIMKRMIEKSLEKLTEKASHTAARKTRIVKDISFPRMKRSEKSKKLGNVLWKKKRK